MSEFFQRLSGSATGQVPSVTPAPLSRFSPPAGLLPEADPFSVFENPEAVPLSHKDPAPEKLAEREEHAPPHRETPQPLQHRRRVAENAVALRADSDGLKTTGKAEPSPTVTAPTPPAEVDPFAAPANSSGPGDEATPPFAPVQNPSLETQPARDSPVDLPRTTLPRNASPSPDSGTPQNPRPNPSAADPSPRQDKSHDPPMPRPERNNDPFAAIEATAVQPEPSQSGSPGQGPAPDQIIATSGDEPAMKPTRPSQAEKPPFSREQPFAHSITAQPDDPPFLSGRQIAEEASSDPGAETQTPAASQAGEKSGSKSRNEPGTGVDSLGHEIGKGPWDLPDPGMAPANPTKENHAPIGQAMSSPPAEGSRQAPGHRQKMPLVPGRTSDNHSSASRQKASTGAPPPGKASAALSSSNPIGPTPNDPFQIPPRTGSIASAKEASAKNGPESGQPAFRESSQSTRTTAATRAVSKGQSSNQDKTADPFAAPPATDKPQVSQPQVRQSATPVTPSDPSKEPPPFSNRMPEPADQFQPPNQTKGPTRKDDSDISLPTGEPVHIDKVEFKIVKPAPPPAPTPPAPPPRNRPKLSDYLKGRKAGPR